MLGALERACPPPHPAGAPASSLLRTLLFLNAVGLRRTWDLRGYAGDALALLTGRERAYGYRHVERFLSALAHAGAADPLSAALAAWTTTVWGRSSSADTDVPPPPFYIDGHRKPVYSDRLIPRGLVARRGAVLGCRALTLLHDADGHPLLATTDRGDTHLTAAAPALLAHLARVSAAPSVRRLVIDREGMAATFLAGLAAAGCDVVTVLRADQYAGLASFAEVGPFTPFQYDRAGVLVREVAPARLRLALALPDQPGEPLALRVALVRDLRARVPSPRPAPNPHVPDAWLEDLDPADTAWYRAGWTATPAPAAPTEPKLIPIVTTAADGDVDAAALARAYFDRWPRQENVIKDWLLDLGLDTNHGYTMTPVENSEVAKRRAALEKRLANAARWAQGARTRYERATKRYTRCWAAARARERALCDELNAHLWDLQKRGVPEHAYRAAVKAGKAAIDGEVDALLHRAYKAHDAYRAEWAKCERYCQEQRTLLRALEDLAAHERTMHALDHGKDQVMTVMKLALANLGMWARDQWFPKDYAHATWRRLEPFFRLPGWIVYSADTVHVELRPFNDRQLNRDLTAVCAMVRAADARLPDGRRLLLSMEGADSLISDVSLWQLV